MGGGSETIRDAQIVGLFEKHGYLKKKLLLEAGSKIPQGMGFVTRLRCQHIIDIKGLYNKRYLEAMGYAPEDGIEINKLSEDKVLEYTKNNINSSATYVSGVNTNTLSAMDQTIILLQDKPNFKKTEMSFTHTDGKKYYYFTAVQNGSYIDISCYLNVLDTVNQKFSTDYPLGYKIRNLNVYPIVNDGSAYFNVLVEYTKEITEMVEITEMIDGNPVIVVKPVITYEQVTESVIVDCVFIYFNVMDEEESQMYAIAEQYSGPFTTKGTYYEENVETGGYTHRATVNGTFTVTYIGNGEFSYHMDAPNPYGSIGGGFRNYGTIIAWENGVVSYQAEKMKEIEQAVVNNVRKLIWDYGTNRLNMDSVRRTYVPGNLYESFIVKEQADAYPIIPLKRNFNLVNSSKMDLVLKKIGIEGKDFHDSIRQKEICDSYLFFGIPVNGDNKALIQYIFEFFATLSNVRENFGKYDYKYGATSLSIAMDGMGIGQDYNISSWVVVEPATKPVGTYWYNLATDSIITDYEEVAVYDESGISSIEKQPIYSTTKYHEYYYQESESYHIRLRINSIRYWYILGGRFWGITGGRGIRDLTIAAGYIIDEDSKNKIHLRLPILKQITNKMDINLLCDVIEQSMSFAVYTKVTVKKKWYQTGFFQFVMIVLIVVIAKFTGPLALALLGPVMGTVVAAAIYLSAFMSIATMVTGTNFGVFGTVVGIVAAIGGGYASLLNSGATVIQTVMFTASQVLNLVSEVNNLLFSMKMGSKQKDYSNQLKQQEEEKKKLSDEYEKLHENQGMIVNMFNNFKSLDDIDNYYNMATANFDSYHLMLDYATDYDRFFETK